MDIDSVIAAVAGVLGGGAVKAAIDHWGVVRAKRVDAEALERQKRLDLQKLETAAEIKGEDTSRTFLHGLVTDERRAQRDCLARVAAVEQQLFEAAETHARERRQYQATIDRLGRENALLRSALLAHLAGNSAEARRLLQLITPPPEPAHEPMGVIRGSAAFLREIKEVDGRKEEERKR